MSLLESEDYWEGYIAGYMSDRRKLDVAREEVRRLEDALGIREEHLRHCGRWEDMWRKEEGEEE